MKKTCSRHIHSIFSYFFAIGVPVREGCVIYLEKGSAFKLSLGAAFPFATAHTFCASQNGPRVPNFLRKLSTISKVFCAVYDNAGREELKKSY